MTVELDPVRNDSNGNIETGLGNGKKKKRGNEKEDPKNDEIMYKIEDMPPWYMCLFLGFQHYLTMFGGTISIPFVLYPLLCIQQDDPAQGYIISTIFFVSGIITLLQTTVGCRLPIIQGGTFTFIVPTIALLNLEKWKCDTASEDFIEDPQEYWKKRMREVQGAICVSAIVQVLIGYSGLLSLMMKYITPLTIGPSVAMIGLSLFDTAAMNASQHWGVAAGTILLMILFSQYLKDVSIPLPNSKRRLSLKMFGLFPVLMTILMMWGICGIYTLIDGSDERISVTAKRKVIENSDWVRIPYPFQWGLPTVSVEGVVGMMAGVLASAIESIGDYYACARLSGAPPPPSHAISRGIGTEGLGCILAGMFGSGNGTTSYSENIGAIGITKVGSRRVVQYAALIMIIFGVISKFGAVFLTIPTPIIGGIFCVMFGIITAVGLSNLQFVNLNSTRNLFILGFSIFFSLVLPKWMESEEGQESVNTGSQILDQIITVLLSTSMFVAMVLGFVLDNTIPGTDAERGLTQWRQQHKGPDKEDEDVPSLECYDLPLINGWLDRMSWTSKIPFLPQFRMW